MISYMSNISSFEWYLTSDDIGDTGPLRPILVESKTGDVPGPAVLVQNIHVVPEILDPGDDGEFVIVKFHPDVDTWPNLDQITQTSRDIWRVPAISVLSCTPSVSRRLLVWSCAEMAFQRRLTESTAEDLS